MDCRSPAAQFSVAPPLDCYLHYRILPAEKAVPSLLTQANGTTAWTCLFSLLSKYSYLASLCLIRVYGSAFLLACQHWRVFPIPTNPLTNDPKAPTGLTRLFLPARSLDNITNDMCHPSWWSVWPCGCARLASTIGRKTNAQHSPGTAITQLMPRDGMSRPMAAGTIIEVVSVLMIRILLTGPMACTKRREVMAIMPG